MKIWLAKNSEIPIHEQLLTQITLGIVSGDLNVGDKIPSTREIARRFDVHSNTVGTVYRKLVFQGLLEYKQGSGFYVRRNETEETSDEVKLDKLINEFFFTAENLGFSMKEIQHRLRKWFVTRPTESFLVVESDAQLREILIEEIRTAVDLPVFGIGYEEFQPGHRDSNAVIAAMIDEKPKLESLLSTDKKCVFLKARSVPYSMDGAARPLADELIAVVSGWEKFTLWAKTFLLGAKIEPENLIVRSTAEANWQKGLQSASMIICDSLTAKNFPNDKKKRVFQVIADDSQQELQEKSKMKFDSFFTFSRGEFIMQSTPNPDVNSPVTNTDSGSNTDVEQENNNNSGNENEEIPVPPDTQPNASIEEPPDTEKPSMEEDNKEPKQIV